MTIKVLLVDDHTIFREALCSLFEKESAFEVVGELGSALHIEEAVESLKPDVILMDVSMDQVNGALATKRALSVRPTTKVIALSGFSSRNFIMEAMDAGASAYIVKSSASSELIQSISMVMAGDIYLCSEATKQLIKRVDGQSGTDPVNQLTSRECAVLRLLAQGFSSPEIGKQLHIAASTVGVHRRNIKEKLQIHTVAELTTYATKSGLIDS